MTSINEAVEAQTGLIKMHDLNINELQTETKKSNENIQQSLQSLEDRVKGLEEGLASKTSEWLGQIDQISSVITGHDEAIGQLSNQLDRLSLEFRGVLQTVDDQVRNKSLYTE